MSEARDSRELRRQVIAGNLAEVHERIDRATRAAGRAVPPDLVVVTKTYPVSDIEILAELGVRDVAENRDQEARQKFGECSGLGLRWHMIGQVQRKKASSVVAWAHIVETVDRPELADALARAAQARGIPTDVLVQVSLDEPVRSDRGGCPPEALASLIDRVRELDGLALRGVMAVAPHPGDPDRAFARLETMVADLRSRLPGLEVVSAGMSGDLEQAIAHGATQVRVGGSILGARPPVQ